MEQRAIHVIARDEAWVRRGMVRYILPLAAVNVGLLGAYACMDSDSQAAGTPNTCSCEDFSADVLDPPSDDIFGLTSGLKLDGRQITKDGMEPMADAWGEPVTKRDGTTVRAKTLGTIASDGSKLEGRISGLPKDFLASWQSAVQLDEVRWITCQMDGGVRLVATDTSSFMNAQYDNKREATEFTFVAGEQNDLFNEGRDLAYAQLHEGGHFLRRQIMTGADEQAKDTVKHIDNLYKQHLVLALEDYRTEHGQQILDDLNSIESQFMALDEPAIKNKVRQSVKHAIAYLRGKLAQPGGLGEVGIGTSTDETGVSEVFLLGLDGMLSKAFKATAKDEESRLDGLGEHFEDYPEQLNTNLLTRTYSEIKQFLIPRFLSEKVLPGSEGSHAWEDSDELFTTSWLLAGLASPNHYEKILAPIPEKYRSLGLEQLKIAAELRKTIDPRQFS